MIVKPPVPTRPPSDDSYEVFDDGDGPYVFEDGREAAVESGARFLADAEATWKTRDAAPLDVIDFEGQLARVSDRLAQGRKRGLQCHFNLGVER